MSTPTLVEDEDLHCARCARPVRRGFRRPPPDTGRGRLWVAVQHWPEGYVCSGCFARASETYGRCAQCGVDRLVPGITATGEPVCADCADLGDFTCQRCGREGWRETIGVCGWCVLADRLTVLLDDGTSRIRPDLVPFFDHVRGMSRPRSGILWLNKPHVPPILRALASGEVPLTHQGLSQLSPWRSVIYVRDLLVAAGVLPPIDRFLFLFEQWLPGWLATIDDPDHRKVLDRYATWHVLRKLRRVAGDGPIGSYRNNTARQQLKMAGVFLTDLACWGRDLAKCTQADLDRWFAGHPAPSDHCLVRPFLRWCIEQRRMARLRLPPAARTGGAPVDQQRRLTLIRRVLVDPAVPDVDRIARLTIDDVLIDEEEVLLRLGDPPTPVPQPFANVLTRYVVNRSNQTTATNPNSRLLFPGRRAGQPLHTTSLRLRLRTLGIPNMSSRTAAIRALLLQAPVPVVAGMLGYHVVGTHSLAAEAGATWQQYAAGDHALA